MVYNISTEREREVHTMKKSTYKKTSVHVAQAYTYMKPFKRYAHKTTRQSLKKFDKEN